jgi:hypothetical protein
VNLGAAAVRGELIKHTGWGGTGHSVIDSDIAGKNAKAPEINRKLGSEYAKESVSEEIAKATFMYSFSGGQQRGATLPQLRVAVLNPEMAPPFVSDALDRMTKCLWYMYQDSGCERSWPSKATGNGQAAGGEPLEGQAGGPEASEAFGQKEDRRGRPAHCRLDERSACCMPAPTE